MVLGVGKKIKNGVAPNIKKEEFYELVDTIRERIRNTTSKPRIPIYLNQTHIRQELTQYIDDFDNYAKNYELNLHGEGKGGVPPFFEVGGGGSSTIGSSGQGTIREVMIAWVFELYAEKHRLLANAVNKNPSGPYFRVMEEKGFILDQGDMKDKQRLPPPIKEKIDGINPDKKKRDKKLKKIEYHLSYQARKGKTKTLAWIHPTSTGTLISIMDEKEIRDQDYMSYYRASLGFFGAAKPETEDEDLIFLTPFWIWQER
jgi:hypothetical protein